MTLDTSEYRNSPVDEATLDAWIAEYESGAMAQAWEERMRLGRIRRTEVSVDTWATPRAPLLFDEERDDEERDDEEDAP